MPTTRRKTSKELELNSFKIKNKNYNLNLEVPTDLYTCRITRGLKKMLNDIKDFNIVESYRSMPLLGDEGKITTDWNVHYVRYDIVFVDKQ